MTNFKGTKGKWCVTSKDQVVRSEEGFTIAAPTGIVLANDWEFNALLISKAPEMLEMLENIEHKLKNGYNITSSDHTKILQLIKEATEL